MKRIQTYKKDDPEFLILQKQFHELTEEERNGLSEWITTQEDYDRMRLILMELHDDQEEWLEPDASIKKNVMRKFAAEEKGGRLIWLNSVFFAPGESLIKQPIFRYGVAAAVVVLAVVFFIPSSKKPELADNSATENSEIPALAEAHTDTLSASDTLRVFAEAKTAMPLPPPIVAMDECVLEAPSEADNIETTEPPKGSAKDEVSDGDLLSEYKDLADSHVGAAEKTMNAQSTQAPSASRTAMAESTTNMRLNSNVDLSVPMADVKNLLDGLYTAR